MAIMVLENELFIVYNARVSTRRKLTQSRESPYGRKAANIDAMQYDNERN
jgi:hypothetical protein